MQLQSLGIYQRVGEVIESPNGFRFDVQGPDGNIYLAKVPKNLEIGSSAERQFTVTARNLKKIDSNYINKVIDSGRDIDSGEYYIILEKINNAQTLESYVSQNNEASRMNIKKIALLWYHLCEGLERASQKNIQHKDLHPKNILVDQSGLPKIIDFGISILEHTISKKTRLNEYSIKFAAPEYVNKKENRLKIRTDIYALSLSMIYSMLGHQLFYEIEDNAERIRKINNYYQHILSEKSLDTLKLIFNKSIAHDPEERYMRYSVLMDDLMMFIDSVIDEPEKPCFLRFINETNHNIVSFVSELNKSGLFIAVDERLHSAFNTVNAKLASENYYVHSSYISKDSKSLMIHNLKRKVDLEVTEKKNHNWIIENGTLLKNTKFFMLDKLTPIQSSYYDVEGLLEKLHIDKVTTTKSALPKGPRQILKEYQTLLEAEIEHLKSQAFSAKYKSFKITAKNEAEFKLNLNFGGLEGVKSLVHRSKQIFRKGDIISLYVRPDPKKEDKEYIGYTLEFNEKDNKLIIRDFPQERIDEVPHNGVLYEDTSMMEIQYRRQVYAIKNYMSGRIINNQLRDYLFQPENLNHLAKQLGFLDVDLEVISKDKSNKRINFEDAQKDAILKSLYRKPLTLIQGPPGTGKTTVITEIILQILKRDRQAKILITSQTNLAVDNVLAKIDGIEGISYIRLGKNIDSEDVQKHSFDNKLTFWANKTKRKSDKYYSMLKKGFDKQNSNSNPILNRILKEFNKKQKWEVTKREIIDLLGSPFCKEFQDLKEYLSSRAVFENKLSEYLGDFSTNFNRLKNLHGRWKSILSNIENRDALKSRFISSINIVGATANHIAAGMYRDYNFEFDYVIMDEAAKATPAEALVPINMAQQVILVGDHLQLPPLVTATDKVKEDVAKKLNFEDERIDFDKIYYDKPSLFEIMFDGAPDEFKEMLDLQFRMPQQIGNLISKLVYQNKLRSMGSSGRPHKIRLRSNSSVFMCDTSKFPNRFHERDPGSKSLYNRCNSDVILEILKTIDTYEDLILKENYEIGVITGYGKQAEYLSNQIQSIRLKNLNLKKNLVVATVDSFQGGERDIIIYDLVRSTKANDNSGLGFLEMPNRINVAFTRSKRLLIIVGDMNFLRNVKPSKRWVKNNKDKPLLLKKFAQELEEEGLVYSDLKEIFYD